MQVDLMPILLGKDYGIKTVINFSNISQGYDSDPKTNPDAKPIEKISWEEFRPLVGDEWSPGMNAPFDPIAAKKAQELGVKVVVLGKDLDNLDRCLKGETFLGTVIE